MAEVPDTGATAADDTEEAPEASEPAVPATESGAAETPVAPTAAAVDESRPNRRKVREGIVVSAKMQSTAVVAVVERVRHPRYRKTVQRTKRLYVHDEGNTAREGDRVRVMETRPISKQKRWRLTEIMERAR